MRKWICVAFLLGFLALAGCSIPVNKSSDNQINKNANSLSGNLEVPNSKASNTVQSSEEKQNLAVNSKEEVSTNNEKKNARSLTKEEITSNNSTQSQKKKSETEAISQEYQTYNEVAVTLYYKDDEGFVIPVTRNLEKKEGIARSVLNKLIDNPANREEIRRFGLFPIIPENTQILGLSIRGGIAVIDFNSKLLNYNTEQAERNIISSIVYTLTEFKTIEGVRILINGQVQGKLKFNTDVSEVMGRESILINVKKVKVANEFKKMDVYLFRNNYILPVSVEYKMPELENLPEKIIEMLKDKYKDKLYSEIPPGTKLLQGSMEGSTLILDFNSEFRKYGGTAREDGILKQILYTSKQINGVEKIVILIEGKENSLPEGTEISGGIAIPHDINPLAD